MKVCQFCGAMKPLDEFHAHKSTADRRNIYCRVCAYAKSKAWQEANRDRYNTYRSEWRKQRIRTPEQKRAETLRTRYGLTIEQVDGWLLQQGGCCAICRKPISYGRRGGMAIDHDHLTGQPRGLLCLHCNSGLGQFRDDPSLLRAALDYLESQTNGPPARCSPSRERPG